jgi:hypothetical protein
MEPLPTPPA